MPKNNLTEYIDNYSKRTASFWQYFKVEPALNNGNTDEFYANNASTDSFKFKEKDNLKLILF